VVVEPGDKTKQKKTNFRYKEVEPTGYLCSHMPALYIFSQQRKGYLEDACSYIHGMKYHSQAIPQKIYLLHQNIESM